MEWHNIKTKTDIDELMKAYGFFHDGCLKELKYISGEYVFENLSMYPINSTRCLSAIFQRQFKDPSTIEVVFDKILRLNLVPVSEEYTGIILCAYMNIVDGIIYWADDEYFDPGKINENDDITWISSSSVKWRIADQYLGNDEIYVTRDFPNKEK